MIPRAPGLDPRAARLLDMLAAGEAAAPGRQSAQDRRASLSDLAALAGDPPPPGVACHAMRIAASDGATLAVRRYRSEAAGGLDRPAMLYLHGGGWVAGDLDTHAGVCGSLAAASGCDVFALDYRRPPEHPFPSPIEDALDALTWLKREATALGLDRGRIVLAGDSAGANLAAAAALDARAQGLALLLLICPILDLQRETGSRVAFARGYFLSAERLRLDVRDYLAGVDPGDPRASPMQTASLAHAPPCLIHAAEFDPFRDEALAFAARLEEAGARAHTWIHPGMIHYFYALPRAIPAARAALAEIGAQVAEALRPSGELGG